MARPLRPPTPRAQLCSARAPLPTLSASCLATGLAPKLLTVGPKLVFSFTVAQYLIAISDRMLS